MKSPLRSAFVGIMTLILVIGGLLTGNPAATYAVTDPDPSFRLTADDLEFILRQIQISEAHAAGGNLLCASPTDTSGKCVPDESLPYGLRTVDGSFNNLAAGQSDFGSADRVFPKLLPEDWRQADPVPPMAPPNAGPAAADQAASCDAGVTCYAMSDPASFVYDSDPRTISNLIVDQTTANPAAVNAADSTDGSAINSDGTIFIPNTAPDEGLSAPFNMWFVFFGQFFDHGLDLVNKGGNGTIIVPLQPDDPLWDVTPPSQRFMVLTRATRFNENGEQDPNGTYHNNQTTPWVDQNQTYTSHPSHQVFLREYQLVNGVPQDTGRLLEGSEGGLATWADVKTQARNVLGIALGSAVAEPIGELNTDYPDVVNVPQVATDLYGNFIPGPNGFPLLVTADAEGNVLNVEGNPAAPISTANAVRTNHAFLDDIAHGAVPSPVTDPENPDQLGGYDNVLLNEHFITGDGRGNENIGLTAVHAVFHAEHNRLRDVIETNFETNPDFAEVAAAYRDQSEGDDWTYEQRLFQAARFGTEMQYQHLVFEEFARRVQPTIDAIVFNENSYDVQRDPAIAAEYAHVVYRFGHSMLTEQIERSGFGAGSASLLDGFLNPVAFHCAVAPVVDAEGVSSCPAGQELTTEEAAGAIVNGTTNQVANQIDEHVIDTLRNSLLGLPLDLAAINIARARDVGTPPLQEARRTFFEATGDPLLEPYSSWFDFGLNLKNGENFGRGGSNASLVNFVAAYGKHPTILAESTIAGKRAAANALVNGVPAIEPGLPTPPFSDLNSIDSDFRNDVAWIYAEEITLGCLDGSMFCPKTPVTREQMASFIARAMDLPESTSGHRYDDVVYPSTHSADIEKIRDAGITIGCGGNDFCPKTIVTREQMASFLARALELPAASDHYFADVPVNGTHAADINKIKEAGITQGCNPAGTLYCPNNNVTREQMAAFLRRSFDTEPAPEPTVGGPEDRLDFMNSTGAWANVDGETITGLEDVDFWTGGLAEKIDIFGGMLGPTFNYVFENQLEDLQFGDRFYYLFRNQGEDLFASLEANSFSKLIQRNTDASQLPADIFSVQDPYFDMEALTRPLPAGLNVVAGTYEWEGDEHIEIHGCRTPVGSECPDVNDNISGGLGDDSLWGYAGNDRIEGGSGNDALIGGPGNDILTDLFGDDNIKGGLGNDYIHAGAGVDLLLGSHGSDFIVTGTDEVNTVFAGTDGDIIVGGVGRENVFGGPGDDWMEGGPHFDLVQGDNANQFQNDPDGGHDVIIGGPGFDDHDSDGGDDILVGESGGADRYEGMMGFDWTTYYGETAGINADLRFTVLQRPDVQAVRDRFDLVEALSGGAGNDVLHGQNAAQDDLTESEELLHKMTDEMLEGPREIHGLLELLRPNGPGTGPDFETRFTAENTIQGDSDGVNNILVGGPGADSITGRFGDDVIDGDLYLKVFLKYNDTLYERASDLQPMVAAGQIDPGQITIHRELSTDPEAPGAGDVIDTAMYQGPMSEYVVRPVESAPGYYEVTHIGFAELEEADGTDILRNIELLQFEDTCLILETMTECEPIGDVSIVNDAVPPVSVIATDAGSAIPVEGQPLTATVNLDPDLTTDPDGAGPLTAPITSISSLSFTWQAGETGEAWDPSDTPEVDPNCTQPTPACMTQVFTPGSSDSGAILRAVVSFNDQTGKLWVVSSLATNIVENVNQPGTGLLVSPNPPDLDDVMIASPFVDADGTEDAAETGITYTWQLSNDGGATWTDVQALTSLESPVGSRIFDVAAYIEGGGTITVGTTVIRVRVDYLDDQEFPDFAESPWSDPFEAT